MTLGTDAFSDEVCDSGESSVVSPPAGSGSTTAVLEVITNASVPRKGQCIHRRRVNAQNLFVVHSVV